MILDEMSVRPSGRFGVVMTKKKSKIVKKTDTEPHTHNLKISMTISLTSITISIEL